MISALIDYLRPEKPKFLEQTVWQPPSPQQLNEHAANLQELWEKEKKLDEHIRRSAKEDEMYSCENYSPIWDCPDPAQRQMLTHQRMAELRWKNHKKLMSEKL